MHFIKATTKRTEPKKVFVFV